MIDYTRLLNKISPQPGGEDVLRLRTGVVDVVNAGGTVDVAVSGVVIPGVPKIAGANVQVGAVVQLLSYRGALLILGSVATNSASSGLGIWTRVRSNSASSSFTSLTAVLTTPTVTFIRNRVYEVRTNGGLIGSSANTVGELRAYRSGGAVLGEFFRWPLTTTNVFNATAGGLYFAVSNSGNVSGAVQLQAAISAGTGQHYANSSTERNLEVYDVGDISQFPGVQTW